MSGPAPGKHDFGPPGNRPAALPGITLAIACLALSFWSTWLVVGAVYDVWRARGWPMVQASVLQVSSSASQAPRRLEYVETSIRYRYIVGDRQYEASRLVFAGNAGKTAGVWDGRWLDGVVAFIADTRNAGRPLAIFVNPADPADAVVFRDMLWGNYVLDALQMLLFSLFPIGIAGLAMPRWWGAATVKAVQIGIALLFVAIALAGAAIGAAA